MNFPTFQAELRRIGGTVQTFAAIGAALRMQHAKQLADPAVQARLIAVVEAVLPGALDELSPQQISDALAYVTLQIGEATDLFHNADRPPGWGSSGPRHTSSAGAFLWPERPQYRRSPLNVQVWPRRSPAACSMLARVWELWR